MSQHEIYEKNIVLLEKLYEGPQTNVFKVLFNDKKCILKEFIVKKVYFNELEALKKIINASKNEKIKGFIEWYVAFDTLLVLDSSNSIICLTNVILMEYIESNEVIFNSIESLKHYMFNLVSITKKLHEIGIYHIDIKPQNYLCDIKNNKFTLIDFSHAYISGFELVENNKKERISNFNLKGTSYYTPPEVKFRLQSKKKQKVDLEKIDVWSIAMTCLVLINQSKYVLSIGNACTENNTFDNPWSKKFFGLEFFTWFDIKKELGEIDYHFDIDFTWNKLDFFYDTNLYGISNEMKQLFNGMLQINPNNRFTLDTILNSPFFGLGHVPNLNVDKLNYFTIRQYFIQEKAFLLKRFNIKLFKSKEFKKDYETCLNLADKLSFDFKYVSNHSIDEYDILVVDSVGSLGGFTHDCAIPIIFNGAILNSCLRLFYGNDCMFYVDYHTFNFFCAMSLNNKTLFKLIN